MMNTTFYLKTIFDLYCLYYNTNLEKYVYN